MFNKQPYTEDDIESLLYSQIFPYLYVDETQLEVLPYLCFEVDISGIPTYTVKDMKLIIWSYCNKEGMQYQKKGYSGTKADILADMVERQLHDSDKFGIGKLELQSVTYFFPSKNHYGKEMIYKIPDFRVQKIGGV